MSQEKMATVRRIYEAAASRDAEVVLGLYGRRSSWRPCERSSSTGLVPPSLTSAAAGLWRYTLSA